MKDFKLYKDNTRIFGKQICEKFLALLVVDDEQNVFLGLVDEAIDLQFLKDILRGYFAQDLPIVLIDKKFFYAHFRFLSFQEKQISLQDNIQEFFHYILQEAIVLGASDIHLENFEDDAWLRFRIDGELQEICNIPKEVFESLCSKIKLEAKLDITQIKQAQDGRYSFILENRDYDFRISCIPLYQGESIVMRILYKQKRFIELEGLEFSKSHLDVIKKNITKTHGIILITGPTGSGKSTTLYAILKYLQGSKKKIITLEDPIEYKMSYATQVQVMQDFGYAKALRFVLRQDPDIIMVGEIRDKETLELSFRAALTGHLVLATLHTNDILNTFDRLQNMGMNEHYILSSLLMIVSQRLLKKLCPFCKVQQADGFVACGCKSCNEQGVFGREVVSEILVLDKEAKKAIKKEALEEYLESSTFCNLYDNAMQKIKEGKILASEIQKI